MRRGWIAGLALLLASGGAQALDNDPALERLCRGYDPANGGAIPCTRPVRPNQAAFKDYTRELGFVFAPRLLQPAETLGISGFQFDVQTSITAINSDEQYWKLAIEDGKPEAVLTTMALDVRKGLPYSFEVGANLTYLFDSELWGLGTSLKWALNEAVDQFPVDFAVRGSVIHLVGTPQMSLTTVGIDGIVSRSFGAAGAVNFGPYLAYSPLLVFARSGVVDATPGTPDDPEGSFTFSGEDQVVHRFVIGVRIIAAAFMFTPEISLTQGMQQYNFQVGLDF
ncbi:MAG: hypothetical protein H6702_03415 [Myxococcales bacterium]|nr:hypothetical protein [Myxococcales bacterium]